MKPESLCTFLTIAIFTLNSTQSRAALLIYEGFNGYTVGEIEGQNPNSNTTGLNTTVGYIGAGNEWMATNTGLSLGSLLVSGGALTVDTGTASSAGARIASTTSATGTIWSSYLVNISANSTNSAGGLQLRVSDNDSNSNERFRTEADTRNSGSNNAAVSYASGSDNSGNALSLNTTYILIGRFPMVGTDISAANPVTATLWALNEAQFGLFLTGGGNETYLDTATVGTQLTAKGTKLVDTNYSANKFSGANNHRLQFLAVGSVTSNETATVDEHRWGTTLAAVTPIPEPSALALISAGAALVVFRRRRH